MRDNPDERQFVDEPGAIGEDTYYKARITIEYITDDPEDPDEETQADLAAHVRCASRWGVGITGESQELTQEEAAEALGYSYTDSDDGEIDD